MSYPSPRLHDIPTINIEDKRSHGTELAHKKCEVNSEHVFGESKSLLLDLFILVLSGLEVFFKFLVILECAVIVLHLLSINLHAFTLQLVEVQLWISCHLLLHDIEVLSQN